MESLGKHWSGESLPAKSRGGFTAPKDDLATSHNVTFAFSQQVKGFSEGNF